MWCCCRRQRWSLGGSEVLSFEGDEGEGSGQLRGRFFRQYPAPPNGPKEDHKEKKVKDSEWKKALEIEGIDEENPPWVEHSAFESTVGAVILLSTICTGLEIDLHEQSDPTIWIIIENFFCVVWITEMVAKLWELRCRYFQDCLNYVDMSLVVLSVFDAWIMPFLVDYGGDLVLFRLVRLVRLLRLVKLLQVLRRFRNLWLMVRGLIESVSTLNWVILMLCLVMYIFAVFLRLAVDCKGLFADWDPECDQYFGTIPKIMYTLVQVLTLESWAMTVGRPLVDRQPLLFIILLLFIFLTTFGLLNIIVGVIVENTLNIAQSDQELQDRRLQRQLLHELEFLRQVFETADFDGSGTLDREEFVEICQRHEVKTALLRMEIPAEQPEELFDILDEDNLGQITFLQFHESVKKVRGVPTAFDMKNMMVSVSDILRRQNRLQTQYERTEQIIYAIFGKTPPARTQGRLTSMDMQDAANIALLQRKSGFAARAQLKRGGSMESMESCFTYATESLGRPASAASPKSMRAEDAFDIGPGEKRSGATGWGGRVAAGAWRRRWKTGMPHGGAIRMGRWSPTRNEKQQEDADVVLEAQREREALCRLEDRQAEEAAELDLAEERLALGEACISDAMEAFVEPNEDFHDELLHLRQALSKQQSALETAQATREAWQDQELQPVLFNSPRQEEQRGSYLQRSPRDRAIIDSIIAGLEVTIKP